MIIVVTRSKILGGGIGVLGCAYYIHTIISSNIHITYMGILLKI